MQEYIPKCLRCNGVLPDGTQYLCNTCRDVMNGVDTPRPSPIPSSFRVRQPDGTIERSSRPVPSNTYGISPESIEYLNRIFNRPFVDSDSQPRPNQSQVYGTPRAHSYVVRGTFVSDGTFDVVPSMEIPTGTENN